MIAALKEELDTFRKDTTEEILEMIGESGKIRTKTEERIQEKLEELNNEILEHFQRQTDEFISRQEQRLIDHQNGLQERINNLLQEIDLIVGNVLQISLQPSSLQLPKALFKKKHIKRGAEQLIERKIQTEYQTQTEYQKEVITTTRGQRMKAEGWINQQWIADIVDFITPNLQYHTVQKPTEVRKPTEIEKFIVYRRDLQDFWEGVIEKKTDLWSRTMLSIVDEQITQAITSVRKQLETQTKTYSDILTQGITDSQLSDTEKKRLLDEKRTCLTQIIALLEQGKAIEETLPE